MEYQDEIERMKHRKQVRRTRSNGENQTTGNRASEQRTGPAKTNCRARKKKKKKIAGKIFLFLVLLIAAAGAYLFWNQKSQLKFWTVAVFGVDSRDGTLGAGTHSDVIMVATVNRETGAIKIVSVFRDTYLKVANDGKYHKINQAFFDGGPKQAVAALEENLDLKIDDYVAVNWKAVADAINILGGVDLEVTSKEYHYINSFITSTVEHTGIGSVHLNGPGMQHLDGVQAVAYARLRLMDTDFNRTERQRKVIGLAMAKAKQADFAVLNNILVTVLPQVSTSISVADLIPMAQDVSKYQIAETGGFPYARADVLIGKKDCVVPLTLESNVIQLHWFLYEDEQYQPSAAVKTISRQIAKDSGRDDIGENASAGLPGDKPSEQPPESPKPEVTRPSASETTAPTEEETTEMEETTESETEILPSEPVHPDQSDPDEPEESAEIGPGVDLLPTTEAPSSPGEKPELEEPAGPGNPGPGVDLGSS